MRTEQLKLVYDLEATSIDFAIQGIEAVLREVGRPNLTFSFVQSDRMMTLAEIAPQIRRRDRHTFHIVNETTAITLGRVTNWKLDFLLVQSNERGLTAWDKWVKHLANRQGFVMAFISDADYDHWQNAKDIGEYEAVGKPHTHLPKRSSALPPPLADLMIDTSSNPGRWIFRQGFIEAVASTMWISDRFWTLAKSKLGDVRPFLIEDVSETLPGVQKLRFAEKLFTDETGERRLQDEIRRALYGKELTS